MANTHWSQNALTVKVFNVNAIVTIPLLFWAIRPTSFLLFGMFVMTLIFFIVVENLLGLRAQYVLPAFRYFILGTNRTPRSRNFDF